MEIITRQQAITQRLSRYFTGVPCKRGHLAERYTRMSACLDCLHPKFDNPDLIDRRALAASKTELVRFKCEIHNADANRFTDMVYVFASLRQPLLKRADVLTKVAPKVNTYCSSIRAYKCFEEDADTLRQIARELLSARGIEGTLPVNYGRIVAKQEAKGRRK